ncbi:MAG: hypothetical protein ACKOXC_05735, partial [Aquirufa sp.]
LMEPSTFHPTKRTFTKQARLTIRAEILPDDPNWNSGSMPTLIHTMPLSDDWMGVKDPFGGGMYGKISALIVSRACLVKVRFVG